MSALDHLRTLAGGHRPEGQGLLSTAHLSGAGLDRMSEEDIVSSFAMTPFDIDKAAFALETPHHAVLIGEGGAIVADVYDGRLGRLWRIGGLDQSQDERRLHVAFDADMAQARPTSLFVRAEDHPELADTARTDLLDACRTFIEGRRRLGNLRVRGFVVRAFGDEAQSAALLSLFTLSDKRRRSASFDFAVVGRDGDGRVCTVASETNPGEWTPRLIVEPASRQDWRGRITCRLIDIPSRRRRRHSRLRSSVSPTWCAWSGRSG
jgi:hypothetical protein